MLYIMNRHGSSYNRRNQSKPKGHYYTATLTNKIFNSSLLNVLYMIKFRENNV